MGLFAANLFCKIHSKSNNRFYIIPGGKTPAFFFNKISESIEDWQKTKLLLSDERITSINEHSNEFMIEKELISKISKDVKPILISYGNNKSKHTVEKVIKNKKPDLAILGLGSDGHTASLFPNNSKILEQNKIFVKTKNNWEDFYRVSLSFEYIMKSKEIIFIIAGLKKAKVLKECLMGIYNPIKYPAQYIFHNYKNKINIICDNESGQFI